METLIYPAINFSILISVLYLLLRKPAVEFVKARHETVRTSVFEVRERLRVAHEQFEEFQAKLNAVQTEMDGLKAQAKRDAEKFREKVLSSAQRTATGILDDAKMSAENSFGDLRNQLRAEMGLKIIQRAEDLLKKRLASVDKAKMVEEFSSLVERE